jgi:hypothetical protein
MKRIKNIAIALLVLLIVAWVGLYVTVRIMLPPEKIQALVEEHGSNALSRPVPVGGGTVGVFPTLRASVTDVQVGNAKGFSERPLMSLGEIRFAIDFKSLFTLSPVIEEVIFVDFTFSYEVDQNGSNNLAGLGAAANGGEKDIVQVEKPLELSEQDSSSTLSLESLGLPGTLDLQKFAIENARIHYSDHQGGVDLVLGAIDQRVDLQIDSELRDIKTQGRLDVRSIEVKEATSGIQKGGVNLSITHDLKVDLKDQILDIQEIQLGFQEESINVRGSITQFLSEEIGVDIKATSNPIPIASLIKEVPASLVPEIQDVSGEGSLQLDLSLLGVIGPNVLEELPQLRGSITLQNVGAQYKPVSLALNSLTGAIVVTEKDFSVEKLRLKVSESDVGLDLRFSNYMSLLDSKKTSKKNKPKLEVHVHSNNLNLDEVLAVLPQTTEEEEEETEPLSQYPRLPDIWTQVYINLQRTQLLNLEMTQYKQSIQIQNQQITTKLKGDLYTGGFSSDAKVDLRDSMDAKVDFGFDLNQVEANDFVSRLNDVFLTQKGLAKTLADTDNQLYGKLSMNTRIQTNGLPQDFANNTLGDITAEIKNGKLVNVGLVEIVSKGLSTVISIPNDEEFPFSEWDMALEIRDGKLIVKHMDLHQTPMGDFDVRGFIGFDNTLRLTLKETLPTKLSQKAKKATKVSLYPVDKQGRVILYHNVYGDFEDVKYELDIKRMAKEAVMGNAAVQRAKQIQDRVQQKAKKAVEDKATQEVKKQSKKILKRFGL